RCGRSRHLARKLSLRRKRSSPNVFEMAATETITSIILIKLIRVSLGTVRHPRRFKIVVIDIQITLKQMLRDFIGIRQKQPYGRQHTYHHYRTQRPAYEKTESLPRACCGYPSAYGSQALGREKE